MPSLLTSLFSLPRLVQIALDLGVSLAAWYAAYLLRFDGMIPPTYRHQMLEMLPVVLALRFVCRFPLGVHTQLWRFVSLREARDIALTITLGSALLVLVARVGLDTHVPRGVLALDWGLGLIGYICLRALRRTIAEWQPFTARRGASKRVLLVGAGQAGNQIAREIVLQHSLELIGFVDDDPAKQRGRVHGVEVLGTSADLPALVERYHVDEVILCAPSATRADMRRILDLCRDARVATKTLPGMADIIAGRVELNAIRAIDIADLLNRDPVTLDHQAAASYVGGRVVLVTGGGGSIGSELCRQIATLGPRTLLVLGLDELSIYTIELELRERFPALDLVPLIADVRDQARMAALFEQFVPDVVFHAAAHKHVPLMERNASEAVLNNVFGTRTVAELAHRFGAETFVFVSTDKAVNPTSVMGATKRSAELVVSDLARRAKTRYMAVRFGNVLDSSGSVVPRFRRQIAAGGPVTVTHPDITRYFMTIAEASQLVIQAGALGRGGEVFVLDMGEPVKIVDLARDMIKLSGFEPDVDVKLKFTGLRPGEKLFEEMLTAEEGVRATSAKKIFIARPEEVAPQELERKLQLLRAAALANDDRAIREALRALVPSYRNAPGERTDALEPR